MRFLYLLFVFLMFTSCKAQQGIVDVATPVMKKPIPVKQDSTPVVPYHQIPDYPTSYEPQNVAARMVDGLGYRYHWVTKDLRPVDLTYQPSESGKTVAETLEHMYGLSLVIKNGVFALPNIRPAESPEHTFEERRLATLQNLKEASIQLKAASPQDLENFKVIFQRGDKISEFPFWHLINGPIADAIYHCGQVVAFRRASGNPQQTGVNVFTGKTKE